MKVLIIDKVHDWLNNGLKEMGSTVDYRPDMDREELLLQIGKYDGLVLRTKTPIDREVLLKAERLGWIGRAGSGLDNIDTAFCDEKGIRCLNAGEANADAVGEHTLGMLLALLNRLVKADNEVRRVLWDREGNRGEELNGKTIGLIGYGHTGKAVARKLSGFGVRVLAYDKYLCDYSDQFATEVQPEAIFSAADIVSFHVPLTDATLGMVNVDYIGRFVKNIYLLNLSRGGVVKMSDVVKMIECGKIKGAAFDVLENENLGSMTDEEQAIFDYLAASPKVVLSPHVAGWTTESYEKISKVLLGKISALAHEGLT